MLLSIAERFRDALVPFLVVGTAILAALFALLIAQRLIRAAMAARRRALTQRYAPLLEAALADHTPATIDAAAVMPRRHHTIAAALLLKPLGTIRGPRGDRAALIADALGLTAAWRDDLESRFWWRRSEAALALGLLRDRRSAPRLLARLDDGHEQVRAAAIDALGQIGDETAIPALLARMADPARHEQTRLVQALRAFGDRAAAALLDHGAAHPADRALVATLLSYVGGAAARGALLAWSQSPDAATRAAAWRALAAVGLDERTYYHAIKALDAEEPPVRAAAATALARSGRTDAAPHLARRLDDEWEVAAQAARALGRLGDDGRAALEARAAADAGLGRDLARQILWEGGRR